MAERELSPSRNAGADPRAVVIATLAAAVIFVVLIWTYSALRVTADCHSTQGHIRIGKSLNGLVCYYHDEVQRVGGG
jgi:hypothetical protein